MPVKKTYTEAEVESAIERADKNYYRMFLRVRNDVSGANWKKGKIKVDRDTSGNPVDPLEWRGRGSDVGHIFRHVDGTANAGKSIYKDQQTAIAVTTELLNSAKGQAALGAMDSDNPTGDETGMDKNRRIVAAVTGDWYGAADTGQPWKKIRMAACEIMKLGDSTLWVHTTYPKAFDT